MTLIQWNTLKCHAASAPGPVAQGSSKFSGSLCQLLSSRAWNDIGILAVKTFRRHKQLVTVFWRVRHLITSSFFRITLDRLGVSWSFGSRRYPDSSGLIMLLHRPLKKASQKAIQNQGLERTRPQYGELRQLRCLNLSEKYCSSESCGPLSLLGGPVRSSGKASSASVSKLSDGSETR